MPKVTLQPLAKFDESLRSYLDLNFRRLSDSLEALAEVEQGTNSVTGSLEIDTGIPEVKIVVASFDGLPSASAAYVYARLKGPSSPRNILIDVLDSTFVLSITAVNISWIAIGKS